jgi:hypothetical protein
LRNKRSRLLSLLNLNSRRKNSRQKSLKKLRRSKSTKSRPLLSSRVKSIPNKKFSKKDSEKGNKVKIIH